MSIRVRKEQITLNYKEDKPTVYKLSQVKEQVVKYKQLCKNISANTGIRKGEVEDVLESLGQQAVQMMEMGHAVQLGVLGTLKPTIQAKCADTKDELSVGEGIVRLKVRFYPGEVFKDLLADMEIETESDDEDDASSSSSSDSSSSDSGEGGSEFT